MKTVPQNDRYYVELEGFDTLTQALLRAAFLQLRGDTRSIPIYQHGEVVRIKRY